MKAAQAVAATKDYAAAQKSRRRPASSGRGRGQVRGGSEMGEGGRLARTYEAGPLGEQQAQTIRQARQVQEEAKDTAGYTAVIAAIAQGSMANSSETKKPAEVEKWYGFAAAMRDDAAAVNMAIHKGDSSAATKAMQKLQQGCDNCHAVFHPEAIDKSQGAG